MQLEKKVSGSGFFGKLIRTAAPLALVLALVTGCPNPGTPDKYATEKTTITKAADRLLQLQNANGSWDWIVTNASGPTSDTYLNITGVTAEGLLDAYKTTGDSKYLTAAKKAGDYIITQYTARTPTIMVDSSIDPTSNNINSFNVKFLYDLGSASGTSSYTTEATTLMNKVLVTFPGSSGPADLINADITYRGTSNGQGIVAWDLFDYVSSANSAGNSNWANGLKSQAQSSPLPPSNDLTYILGLSAFAGAGNASALSQLQAAQNSDGTWSDADGTVQDTAYAVMALVKAKDMTRALSGVQAGVKTQLANGGWYDASGNPVNNDEVTEVNSEVIQAISDYISSNP